MFSDSATLNKLIALYMLRQVKFPMTNAQMSEFFLSKNYTTYFNFQKVMTELEETGLIRAHSTHNITKYEISEGGADTLKFFVNRIPPAVIEDVNDFLRENRFRFRSDSGNIAEYYQTPNLDYMVHFEIREGKTKLIDMHMAALDEESAKHMCDMWRDKSVDIYQFLIQNLM